MATSGSTRTTLISPFQYFADPTRARPIFNGFIFIGRVDGDPTNTADQIPVQVICECGGTPVNVTQPVRTGPGGVPIYNGNPAQIVVCRSNYSITLQDKDRVQVYHSPDVQSGFVNQPITHLTLSAAIADDNSVRSAISVLDRPNAIFRKVDLDEFNSFRGAAPYTKFESAGSTPSTYFVLNLGGFVFAESCGIVGDGATDDLAAINAAKDLRIPVLFSNKEYATSDEIQMNDHEKLVGLAPAFQRNGPRFKWIGATDTMKAVVRYCKTSDFNVDPEAISNAEVSNILADGQNKAGFGFVIGYITNGSKAINLHVTGTTNIAHLVYKCWYCEIDRLSTRDNQGSGTIFGAHPILTYTGDKAVNGLGEIKVESHSNGRNDAWHPDTNPDNSLGFSTFGTMHRCTFDVTSELNRGPGIVIANAFAEINIKGYVESSSLDSSTPGEYSVWLRDTTNSTNSYTLDLQMNSSQGVRFESTCVGFYKCRFTGSDPNLKFNDNGFSGYRVDPSSTLFFRNSVNTNTLTEFLLGSDTANLNATNAIDLYNSIFFSTRVSLRVTVLSDVSGTVSLPIVFEIDGQSFSSRSLVLTGLTAYQSATVSAVIPSTGGLLRVRNTTGSPSVINCVYELSKYGVTQSRVFNNVVN